MAPIFYLPHKLERAVTTFHDISIFTCPEYHPKDRVRYMEKSLHESLDSAKLILTVSDFSRSEIIRLFNYPAERIVTTKLACSSDYIPRSPAECLPVLQKYQLAWQAYALYIGTMEPRKNIRGLLHAYQLLPMEIRMRYPLILSGYRGWEDDVLWQLVERGTRKAGSVTSDMFRMKTCRICTQRPESLFIPPSTRDSVYLFLKRCLAVCR